MKIDAQKVEAMRLEVIKLKEKADLHQYNNEIGQADIALKIFNESSFELEKMFEEVYHCRPFDYIREAKGAYYFGFLCKERSIKELNAVHRGDMKAAKKAATSHAAKWV
jgi:hypothetical protein